MLPEEIRKQIIDTGFYKSLKPVFKSLKPLLKYHKWTRYFVTHFINRKSQNNSK